MPNLFTRLNLARKALFSTPAVTALALERAAVKDMVGTFPTQMSPLVSGLLGGALPGSRGEPPPRGTADYLRAYSTMPWLRAVVDRHATAVAAVPWKVQALRAKNGKYIADPILRRAHTNEERLARLAAHKAAGTEVVDLVDHPLYQLLHGGNDMMTGGSVRMLTVLYLDLVGEGFFIKQRNKAGAPIGLWPVPPHWVRSTPTPAKRSFDVQVNTWNEPIPDTDVLWLKRIDPFNPYGRGTGITQSLSDELETDEFAAKMAKQAMFNRGDPSLIVSPKDGQAELKEDQAKRMEQSWLNKHRGFWKVALPHFSSRPIDVKVISRNFEELQLVPLREFERNVLVQVFGMPPEQLGIIENSNRSTIDASDLLFAKNLTVPTCEFLREHYQERLAPEYDERILVDYVSPVAEDKDRQLEARKAAPYTVKVNEWRASQGLEPDTRVGDGYMVPFTTTFVDDLSDVTRATPSVGAGNDDDTDDEDDDVDEGDEKRAAAVGKGATRIVRPSVFRAGQYNAKAIALDDDYYTLVHLVADRLTPKLRRQFMQTIARIQDETVLADLEAAFASGQLAAAEDVIPWARLEAELNGGTAIIRQALVAAGEAAAGELGQALGVTLRFDRTNPAAAAWASENAARYVTEVSGGTRAAIHDLIASAYEKQQTAQESARLIRDVIGLHSRQVAAVQKFRTRLLDRGVDGDALEKRVQKYAAAQLRRRASTIAEHELMTASNMGQRHLWRQALMAGHLAQDKTRRRWIVTPDERLEEVCEEIPHMAENQDVKLDGKFTSPRDGRLIDGPPEHVKDRCAEGLEIDA